ncbi:MAG: 4Fe-4S dicluster domain-containing protein [Syntrophaceae bacterium]
MRPKRYAMTMDTKKCVGCSACVIACKNENQVPLNHYRDWIEQELSGDYPHLFMEIRSQRCNHCSDPPCVGICPTGASWKTKDGIVLVDKKKCIGCKACIAACPYDARYVHPQGYVDKCTFCIHRLKSGLTPACVEICPTASLVFGDINDPNSEISKVLNAREYFVNHVETGCKPNLYFLK